MRYTHDDENQGADTSDGNQGDSQGGKMEMVMVMVLGARDDDRHGVVEGGHVWTRDRDEEEEEEGS